MNPIAAHMSQNFYDNYNTLSIPKLHNYRILLLVHKFTYHNSKLPIVFILMIINYFMKIILVGKIASPNWLPYILLDTNV